MHILYSSFQELKTQVGVRYCLFDKLLPLDVARNIYEVFPLAGQMRLINAFREKNLL